ncbi:MAG TPA: cysteine dioxygenase family protein [Candidatus Polarisedimenticolia bacterium]|jgi:predicted metal-dependent enzyme (double-stranded beta helix superfamily)
MTEAYKEPAARYAPIRAFLRDMDEIVARGRRTSETALAVKERLAALIAQCPELPEQVLGLSSIHYARHLLYRDPAVRYEVVVMAWGPGQHTPIHDHSGIWCVEGVIEGTIDVTRYDVKDLTGDSARVEPLEVIHAGLGQCGALIPPVEYHRITNATPRPAFTIHVYGGTMATCRIFTERADGRYAVSVRELDYSSATAAL